jgi:hypothetical protein
MSQPSSSEDTGVDETWTSFFTEINGGGDGDDTLIWDVDFPLRDLIEKHFGKEKFHEKVEELGLEKELQNSMANCIRMSFLLRVIGRMFGDIEKENKAFVAEITELKKLTTSLKDERNKLKKTLEKSHKVTVDKLKAEIEELKGEISLQYKAGYDNAVKQVLYFASRLKP